VTGAAGGQLQHWSDEQQKLQADRLGSSIQRVCLRYVLAQGLFIKM